MFINDVLFSDASGNHVPAFAQLREYLRHETGFLIQPDFSGVVRVYH